MPDLIDQILNQALSEDPTAGAKRFLLSKQRERERLIDKRAELLAQPDLLEKRV